MICTRYSANKAKRLLESVFLLLLEQGMRSVRNLRLSDSRG